MEVNQVNNEEKLNDYGGSLAVVFSQYPGLDLSQEATMFFQAPEAYLRSQINSYGGILSYTVTYGGGNVWEKITPDVLLVGGEGKQLLFYSGLRVQANTPADISVPIDRYYWTTVSGGEVDRETLMVVLNSLEGLYIRAR